MWQCGGDDMDMILSEQEVAALTLKRQPSAQARALKEAGIPFRIVSGRPVVARAALVDTLSGGRHTVGPQLRLKRA